MNTQIKSYRHGIDDIHQTLYQYANEFANDLHREKCAVFETIVKLYLHPYAFDLLKKYQGKLYEGDDDASRTLLGALNALSDSEGVEELLRTLRNVQKERKAA
jgi:hypothetical protein